VQEVTSIRTPGPSAPERPDIEAQDLLVIIAAIELLRRGMQLRSCQLTLLTSLAFGAVLAVFSAPLTAQTTQDLPTTIPNLSGYDGETRRTMELACVSEKTRGPVVYGACLNQQIASLRNSPGIPNLSGYDGETRRTMELACVSEKTRGPVVYGACLNQQIASLRNSPGIPNLSGYDRETRRTKPPASKSAGANSEQSRRGETDVHSFFGMSRFTTENIMKVHQGMGSNEILEMFGAPKNVSQSVCGASVGTPWTCTTWEYGQVPYDWASFTFAGDSDSLILNNFNVHKF
jgi:hypothetical protein